MKNITHTLATAFIFTILSSNTPAATNTVNLSQFPDTGNPVPSNTLISNQWQSIGILFSARVDSLPIGLGAKGSPPYYISGSPDEFGTVAIFDFVDTNTFAPAFADYFQLTASMDPDESITLIGFTENGETAALTNYFSGSTGGFHVPTPLSISGRFKRVECQTFGNPGIGMYSIKFQTVSLPRVTISDEGSDANVCWSTVAGWRYQLEYRSSAPTPTWTPLGDVIVGSGSTACASHSQGVGPMQWYRVRMLP